MTATLSESAAREAAGFTRAICLQPGDDTPRLAFADWLDEHAGTVPCRICHGPGFNRGGLGGPIGCTRCRGELVVSDGTRERAEFIRVQVAIAAQFDARGWGPRNRQPLNLDMFLDPQDADDQTWKHRMYALGERERELWRILPREGLIPEGFAGHYGFTPDAPNTSVAIVSRGFVAEVRCDTATLLGGPCGPCGRCVNGWQHSGSVDGETGFPRETPCKTCKGTGRTEGVAKALFAAHPITAVALVDLQPYHNGAGWCWFDPDRTPPYNDVPATANPPRDVYRLLTGHLSGRSRWRGYGSQAAATDALSRAAVAHCRGLAGLPPLG